MCFIVSQPIFHWNSKSQTYSNQVLDVHVLVTFNKCAFTWKYWNPVLSGIAMWPKTNYSILNKFTIQEDLKLQLHTQQHWNLYHSNFSTIKTNMYEIDCQITWYEVLLYSFLSLFKSNLTIYSQTFNKTHLPLLAHRASSVHHSQRLLPTQLSQVM